MDSSHALAEDRRRAHVRVGAAATAAFLALLLLGLTHHAAAADPTFNAPAAPPTVHPADPQPIDPDPRPGLGRDGRGFHRGGGGGFRGGGGFDGGGGGAPTTPAPAPNTTGDTI